MRMLIACLLLIATSAAHAETKFGNVIVNTEAISDCRIDFPFNPAGMPNTRYVIFWSGKCLNGRADGFGYISGSNSEKGYFAEFRNGSLYNGVFAELRDGGTPKVMGYAPNNGAGVADENFCAKNADRCNRLMSYLKENIGLTIGSETEDGCGIDILVQTTPYFDNIKWSGKCVNGRAEGPGWMSYTTEQKSTIETYTEFSKGKSSNAYYYRRIKTATGNRSEFLGKQKESLIASSVKSCNGDQSCQRVSNAGQKGPGQAFNKSAQNGNRQANNANAGDVSSGSNSNSSGGSRGNIMAKPGPYVTDEGPYIGSCDVSRIQAEQNRYAQKIIAEHANSPSVCWAAKGEVKLNYFNITLLQKNCPGDPRAEESIAMSKDLINQALETMAGSCAD